MRFRNSLLIAIGLGVVTSLLMLVRSTALRPGPSLPNPPLKTLADKQSIQLGSYAALKRLDEKPYTDVLNSQFEFISIDGEPNWTFNDGSLRPSPTTYDFSRTDKVFHYAANHRLPVQAHHLVWGEDKWLPDWLKNGNYSKDQLLDLMHQHISTVAGHYKGQVREWTVVNEAFTRGLHQKGLHDWWADHTGDQSYIDQAFIWAHQTDPHAVLLMNDFNNETAGPVSDAMYTYIAGMKFRGVPIDGIGMQMHIEGSAPPAKADVITNMQRFAGLGLKVYVTEFDVNMSNVKATDSQKQQIQAHIYYDMLRACIESKVCPSFATLGITDKETWYNELGVVGAMPLPFDWNYRPKPAYWAMRQALQQ